MSKDRFEYMEPPETVVGMAQKFGLEAIALHAVLDMIANPGTEVIRNLNNKHFYA